MQTAQAQAKKSNRIILANFTGSDWCPYCMKLKAEVFDTQAFAKWAAANVILLEVDFPNKGQAGSLKKQNEELKKTYSIAGYPTVLFLDADGKKVGEAGYTGAKAEDWIKAADEILADRPKAEVPTLTLSTKLGESLEAAKAQGKPLLLVINDPKRPEFSRAFETLQKAPEFVKVANRRTVAVNLTMPIDPESEDGKTVAGWYESLKLPRGQIVALIDLAENKLLFQSAAPPKAEALVPAIRKALPLLKYDGSWLEDFGLAQELAVQMKRPVLVDFTGSDWCTWCMKLDAEVFNTDAFKKAAADGLILVKVDFPKRKQVTDEQKQRNETLRKQFEVSGFPTVIVLDSAGAKLGTLGYMEGGPTAFLARLKEILGPKGGK
jgi:protein disulfide-isomerase